MAVLIFGHAGDEHAHAACEALAQDGVKCAIFCNDQYPGLSTLSVEPKTGVVDLAGPDIDARFQDFSTVWNRRRKPASLPESMHETDKAIALSECQTFLQELRIVSYPGQTWVNGEEAQFRIRGKTNQLILAHAIGMTIPRTLISNDPDHVRAFVRGNERSIVKAVDKIGWIEGAAEIVLPTSPVTIEDCVDDSAIRLCPMIYQEQIDKAYELRIVAFGDHLLCVKLDSQSVAASQTDWRNAAPNSFAIEEIALPAGLGDLVREFCRQADILHGSFDFAVDPSGKAVFFELNVQGQSFWLEDWNPNIRVLDRMVSFLKVPTRSYRYDGTKRHSYRDFLDRWQSRRV